MNKKNHERTRKLVGVALFTAIIVVLQLLGAFIRFGPFSISLVLVPIVVGAAVYGIGSGAWLGFVFGVVVLFTDAAAFLAISVPGTIVTVLLKGAVSGLASGLVYQLLAKKNEFVAVICAAVVCPVVGVGKPFSGQVAGNDVFGIQVNGIVHLVGDFVHHDKVEEYRPQSEHYEQESRYSADDAGCEGHKLLLSDPSPYPPQGVGVKCSELSTPLTWEG